jgi:hypothetical protein
MKIHHMTIIRYFKDNRPWISEDIVSPSWEQIEAAIRKMDNYCFPIVQLNPTEYDDCEEIFNVMGGNGRWAVFHMMGEWQYEDKNGSNDEVRLWESDQGYYCKGRNIIKDIEKVLKIAKLFYETACYDNLDKEGKIEQ